MFKFSEFIIEAGRGPMLYKISFIYKGEKFNFESSTMRDTFCKVCDWLYDNGFNFSSISMSIDEMNEKILKTTYTLNHFHNLSNSGNIIQIHINNSKLPLYLINRLKKFLTELNVTDIQSEGFELYDKNKKYTEEEVEEVDKDDEEPIDKMTFAKAAQVILQDNGNKPMNSSEIWSQIKERELVETSGLTPQDSLNSKMILYSINSTAIGKKKNSIFKIVEGTKPYKFILINPDEIQDVPDVEEDEIETSQKSKVYVKSPFRQSICILGPSGKGKSYTTELMLEQLENTKDSEFEFIIPTASTTGLLSQYSPKGTYIKSRLGRMIMSAHNNPNKLVTAIFDECHKSAVIEMINDELLQCISTRRNAGRRFISVDEETGDLYTGLSPHRGNLLIPDNFGFIFLSSKPDVIISNSDFFNRVDIYVLTEQPSKDSDLSLDYDEEGNVILPSYFTKIEGKDKDAEDDINNLLQ
jgi:hypothetical protein